MTVNSAINVNQEHWDGVLKAVLEVVELRDPVERMHAEATAALAEGLARQLGLPAEQVQGIKVGAMLHDIGKMAIPEAVLNKAGKLTIDERQLMDGHPELGWRAIKHLPLPWDVSACILGHHERWDGRGYPKQLKGDEIPIGAQVVALVDMFDALVTDLPYKPAWGRDEALAEIKKLSGSHFSPQLVESFDRFVETELS